METSSRGFIESHILQEQINKVRRDTERTDRTSRDTELPDYSDDPVRLSPVNSSPPGAPDPSPAGTILLYYYYYYYLFFLSTFAPGAKPTIKIMCLSEDLILNCHARSTSQITADPVFPPADTQTQEMINLPRPGGWLARVFGFRSNETTRGSHLNENEEIILIIIRRGVGETVVLSAATFSPSHSLSPRCSSVTVFIEPSI